ncbi:MULTISPECIES: NAD(P)/FAD-dependent oxidoreductase [unclassified Oceanispirochaeta]|uniref:phytoene desaturase family protein n=1 Tax=unclassified Oceanispirochaeta TaxID=2635722 RepID=UPI001313FEC4|nr:MULTISPECIES: NAD(P)/FAD-dependent oxidoreductase [unclassified Oceanispirochaeta]MBF9016481.1 NAD(P)/FAD-dependent oxidoreductase [Oceanispirochaeta sp. M2]NPD72943.1 NAD(P)/FAD-dependent oxidoreductase [Oceanispirochaeta sp. M1]
MAAIKLEKESIKSNCKMDDKYDLIIIGSGISGLTTALLWQKTHPHEKILIIEKEPYPGGYVTSFERDGFVFETTQLFPDVIDIMKYMEIDLPLKQYKNDFMRRFIVEGETVREYHLPAGAENLKKALQKEFPEDADKIAGLFDYSVDLFKQVRSLKANSNFADKLKIPFSAPKVVKNLNMTYSELLDMFKIDNPSLRELMETFTSFAGVPPGKASSILTTGAMLSSISRCFRPLGYFDGFPAAMASNFQKRGGELLLNTEIKEIVIEEGAATAVKIGNETVKAARIITTIDPMVAMHKLVGDENLPKKYLNKLDGIIMSSSSFNVSLGLDNRIDMSKLDMDYPYIVLSTELGTTDRLFDAFLKGENGFSEKCFHLGVICPSLTTGGKNTITIRAVPFAPADWLELRKEDPKKYKAEKDKWADFFIGVVEKYIIPDLRKHIEVIDTASPASYARYSGSPTGSLYDMASLVTQFGPKRLSMKTPIKNLYQPKFSHGIYGTMSGAVQVVDLLMDRKFNGGDSLFHPR